MRIYPSRPGLVVRDPIKRDIIPPGGREVPDDDQYWNRRLIVQDVTKTPPAILAASSVQVDEPVLNEEGGIQ